MVAPQIYLKRRVVEQIVIYKAIYRNFFEAAPRFQLLGCEISCDFLLLVYFIVNRAILPISLKVIQGIYCSRDMISDITTNKLQSWAKYLRQILLFVWKCALRERFLKIFQEIFASIDKILVLEGMTEH